MRWSTRDVYTSASDPPLSLIWALQGGLYWFSQGLDPVAGAHWHHGSLADSSGLTVCMLVQCWWFCLVSCPGPFLFPLLSIALLDDDTPIWVSLFDMFESKLVKLLWLRGFERIRSSKRVRMISPQERRPKICPKIEKPQDSRVVR